MIEDDVVALCFTPQFEISGELLFAHLIVVPKLLMFFSLIPYSIILSRESVSLIFQVYPAQGQ